MRAYVIDEICAADMERVRSYLRENAIPSRLDDLFWIPVPDHLLRQIQAAHSHCGPHVFALETGRSWIRVEFLVRAANSMQCNCAQAATRAQRDYLISFADRMVDDLRIMA